MDPQKGSKMNREEEKARSVLGAEAMSDAMWEWGDE